MARHVARREELSLGRLGSVRCVRSTAVVDRGSVFVAHCAFPVTTRAAAEAAVSALKRDDGCRNADHCMSAWRVPRPGKALGVAVVVARHYGGQNIGKARFNHIRERAGAMLDAIGAQPDVIVQSDAFAGPGRALGGPVLPWGHPPEPEPAPRAAAAAPVPPAGPSAEQRRALALAAAERRASQQQQPQQTKSPPPPQPPQQQPEVVDLAGDSDDDGAIASKRQRTS